MVSANPGPAAAGNMKAELELWQLGGQVSGEISQHDSEERHYFLEAVDGSADQRPPLTKGSLSWGGHPPLSSNRSMRTGA